MYALHVDDPDGLTGHGKLRGRRGGDIGRGIRTSG